MGGSHQSRIEGPVSQCFPAMTANAVRVFRHSGSDAYKAVEQFWR